MLQSVPYIVAFLCVVVLCAFKRNVDVLHCDFVTVVHDAGARQSHGEHVESVDAIATDARCHALTWPVNRCRLAIGTK